MADAFRGKGYGRRLLEAAEEEGRRRGCREAYLDTFEFQAKSFYEGLGYSVFGVLEGYPPGYDRYCLRSISERGITELTEKLGVSYPRVNELIHGKRGVTPDTALRKGGFIPVNMPRAEPALHCSPLLDTSKSL